MNINIFLLDVCLPTVSLQRREVDAIAKTLQAIITFHKEESGS